MIFDLPFFQKECTHPHVSADKDYSYCPDCGEFIENKWYLTRCKCCGIKRKTVMKRSVIMPESRYCPNCGAEAFYVEQVEHINFVDINFAVLKKEIVPNPNGVFVKQIWEDEHNSQPQKLLAAACC